MTTYMMYALWYTVPANVPDGGRTSPISPRSQSARCVVQLMRERLVQQQQQTQAALAQVHLVRDQLQAETAARLEAQARTHQLLLHNRELLDHVQVLVSELQSMEERDAAASAVRDKVRGRSYPAGDRGRGTDRAQS